MANWARNDPIGSGQWLAKLPADSSRDKAVQSYASALGAEYPESAAKWVSSIVDEPTRFTSIETLARQWMGIDQKAGQAWLSQTTLPPERQQQVIKQATSAPGGGARAGGGAVVTPLAGNITTYSTSSDGTTVIRTTTDGATVIRTISNQ